MPTQRVGSVRERSVNCSGEVGMERSGRGANETKRDTTSHDAPTDAELPAEATRHAGIGMLLFVLYLACYAGFVLTSAFRPAWMAQRPWAGVNLAIWYGFGLIGLALALAVVYSWLCRARDAS